MRRLLALLVVLAGIAVSGCSTTTLSPAERWQQYCRVADVQSKQFADDWDYFWLLNQPVGLSRYHVRTGTPD